MGGSGGALADSRTVAIGKRNAKGADPLDPEFPESLSDEKVLTFGAQEPGEMWIKYRKAMVDEKKTVSDL